MCQDQSTSETTSNTDIHRHVSLIICFITIVYFVLKYTGHRLLSFDGETIGFLVLSAIQSVNIYFRHKKTEQ